MIWTYLPPSTVLSINYNPFLLNHIILQNIPRTNILHYPCPSECWYWDQEHVHVMNEKEVYNITSISLLRINYISSLRPFPPPARPSLGSSYLLTYIPSFAFNTRLRFLPFVKFLTCCSFIFLLLCFHCMVSFDSIQFLKFSIERKCGSYFENWKVQCDILNHF